MAPSRAVEGTGRDGPIGHPAHLPPFPGTMGSGMRVAPGANPLGPRPGGPHRAESATGGLRTVAAATPDTTRDRRAYHFL